MKKFKRIALLVMASCLLLTACDGEGGGGISVDVDSFKQQEGHQGTEKTPTPTDGGYSGGGGGGTEHQQDDQGENGGMGDEIPQGGNDVEVPLIEIENKIVIFNASFITIDEETYVNLVFDNDPFADKYNFAYYTINEEKLDKAEYMLRETIDDQTTYKVFLGSNQSGTYVIKFYNTDLKQYGTCNLSFKLKSPSVATTYFSMTFNLVQIRLYSIGHAIERHFRKIEETFRRLFQSDHINL